MTFNKGDRVHVEFDGVVDRDFTDAQDCWDVNVLLPDLANVDVYVRHEHVTLIEPKYEVGAYYIDANDRVFCRGYAGWRDTVLGAVYRDDAVYAFGDGPTRPFRKLVPES